MAWTRTQHRTRDDTSVSKYRERAVRVPNNEVSIISHFNCAFPISQTAQRGRFRAQQTGYVAKGAPKIPGMSPEEGKTCRDIVV